MNYLKVVIKKMRKLVGHINDIEPEFEKLTDEEIDYEYSEIIILFDQYVRDGIRIKTERLFRVYKCNIMQIISIRQIFRGIFLQKVSFPCL